MKGEKRLLQRLHVWSEEQRWHSLRQATIQPSLIACCRHRLHCSSDLLLLLQYLDVGRLPSQAHASFWDTP